MTSGGKIILGLLAMGGITLAVFHSGKASAAPLPPRAGDDDDDPVLPPGSILPPAGTPIPGGGAVPSIPGLNAPGVGPLPSVTLPPLVVPLPASTSPFPAGPAPAPSGTINVPGLGNVTLPPGLPSLPREIDPLQPPTAPQSAADLPGSAPSDTLALVKSMLRTEQAPRWRISDPLLKSWQAARRRTADGLFGTGDALVLAQEIGTIPIIRAWPKGSFPGDGKLEKYRAALQQIATSAPEPRASQLRASAARELGQGYGTPEKPIATLITIQS